MQTYHQNMNYKHSLGQCSNPLINRIMSWIYINYNFLSTFITVICLSIFIWTWITINKKQVISESSPQQQPAKQQPVAVAKIVSHTTKQVSDVDIVTLKQKFKK